MTEESPLAVALAAFQADLPRVGKGNTADMGNYSYAYADLADVSQAVLPKLAEHGLSFSTKPTLTDDGRFVLRYTLRHGSGETDSGDYPIASNGTPQQMGSAITYARRYALLAVTGVAPDHDDDDGQAAQQAHTSGNGQTRPAPPPLTDADKARQRLLVLCDQLQLNPTHVGGAYAEQHETGLRHETDAAKIEAFITSVKADPDSVLPKVDA
jgi:hypothetical protein